MLFEGLADELVDSMQVRKRLHSKLAVESPADLTILLIWTHRSMPDYTKKKKSFTSAQVSSVSLSLPTFPLVNVANSDIQYWFATTPRTVGMVPDVRRFLRNHLGQQMFVNVA